MAFFEMKHDPRHGVFTAAVGVDLDTGKGEVAIRPPVPSLGQTSSLLGEMSMKGSLVYDHVVTTPDCTIVRFIDDDFDYDYSLTESESYRAIVEKGVDALMIELGSASDLGLFHQKWENQGVQE